METTDYTISQPFSSLWERLVFLGGWSDDFEGIFEKTEKVKTKLQKFTNNFKLAWRRLQRTQNSRF